MKAFNQKTLVGVIMLSSMIATAATAPISTEAAYTATPSIVIDGLKIHSDTDPYIVDGTTLVPLRAISENMGATVEWNAETRTIHIEKEGKTIDLTIGQNLARANGQPVTISLSPRITNGRTMVPLRFIGETLNCEVSWIGESKTVLITTSGQEIPAMTNDSFGRAIRTTNLPSNAADFPYIAEEIPNWCYELQPTIMKNNYWGPGYYKDTGLKGDTAADVTAANSSLYPILCSEGVYETVDKFVNLQTNIDYNTIGSDWVNGMLSCFSDSEIKALEASTPADDPIKTVKADLEDIIASNYKPDQVITTGEAKVMPEAMWVDIYGLPHVPVYLKYTINNSICQENYIKNGGNNADFKYLNINYGGTRASSNPAKGFQVGKTYEAVVTYTLTKDSKGEWKIAWCACDPDGQINPSCDNTDGVKPSDKDPNRLTGFEYTWSNQVVDRYEQAPESKFAPGFNPITGLTS